MIDQERQEEELRRLLDEQGALRRVATLVASGVGEDELFAAVTAEIAQLFGGHTANTMRWDGDTIHVLGHWNLDPALELLTGRVFAYGGDTITVRIVESAAPQRIESPDDFTTEFARERWRELGIESTIGAPIVVDGRVWGVVTISRTTADDPFPPGAEHRLGDFAALISQAVANSDARRELARLAQEQAALRRVATLVAAGRSQEEVFAAITREVGEHFGAQTVSIVEWRGVLDEVAVLASWSNGDAPDVAPGSFYHPRSGGATLRVLETGHPSRTEESSAELGDRFVIAAPVIVNANLLGALTAMRPGGEAFALGAELRLRNFGNLAAQAIANHQAGEEMRASRARIVRAADEARAKLERNLHDGAQQRLVAVSISLRLALAQLSKAPDKAHSVLTAASEELTQAIEDLRELARGIHPSILTERGLGPALEVLAGRTPLRVSVANGLEGRLPASVEAAAYYVVAESLTNVAKYAQASSVSVRVSSRDGLACVEVVDDGVGGADPTRGSGIRGLADRVEALDGRLGVESPPGGGTRVWAELPLHSDP